MNCGLIRTGCLAFVALAAALGSHAAASIIVPFDLTGADDPAVPATPFTILMPGISDGGVLFDVELTVAPFPLGFLTQGGDGLGVPGGTLKVDPGEYLTFTMSIMNVVGGTAIFDEFTEIVLHGLENGTTFSDDNTTGGAFATASGTPITSTNLTGLGRTTFTALPSNSISRFRAFSVNGAFTGTAAAAVPEPSTVIAFCAVGAVAGVRRLRRRTAVA